jgi:hypothetical protein
MYIGAQLRVGVIGGNLEVVTITNTIPVGSFTATFVNSHAAGEPIFGATFPVRQTTDPLFTQAEMLAYLSTALNDFLTDCPLVYNIEDLTVAPAAQNAALPPDCLFPVRMAAFGYPLRETSQSNLDAMDYRWQIQAASEPYTYFRDKTALLTFGIWPRANNTTEIECVYAQREAQVIGLGDGFLIPDPFLIYVKYRVLGFAYAKDGEMRNPGLAKYYQGRYEFGVKVSNMFLAAIQDPNLEMTS